MAQVVYSVEALTDFEQILDFLLEHSLEHAAPMVEIIQSAIEILETHPLIGRRIEGDLRELVISQGRTGYIALYRFDPAFDVIRIPRLRHQREAGYRE